MKDIIITNDITGKIEPIFDNNKNHPGLNEPRIEIPNTKAPTKKFMDQKIHIEF